MLAQQMLGVEKECWTLNELLMIRILFVTKADGDRSAEPAKLSSLPNTVQLPTHYSGQSQMSAQSLLWSVGQTGD